MFSNISWKDYSIFLLVVLFIYYSVVFIVLYNNAFAQFLKVKFLNKTFNSDGENNLLRDSIDELYNGNNDPAINPPMSLKNEIKSRLEKAKIKKTIPEEIMMSLQLILQNYDSLKLSQSKQEINNYIKEECENICSIHFSEEEINQMWTR